MQARLERTAAGRALISILLVVMLACIAATNLPASQVRARLYPLAQPVLNALGLDQNWGVFAPNPRNPVVFVESHVDYADGSSAVLPIPADPGLAAYRDYRWHKYAEQMHRDVNERLWPVFAGFVATRERDAGRDPVRVTLVRRVSRLLPPGPGPDNEPYHEERFFTLELGEPS